MSFIIKALLAVVASLTLVGLLPKVGAAINPPSDNCQPIYFAETMDGDHEVLVCITSHELIYQYGKTDGEVFEIERFDLKDVVVKNYYVNAFDTAMYEVYLENKESGKLYGLLMYSTDSKIQIVDGNELSAVIVLNQDTEINNLGNLVGIEK